MFLVKTIFMKLMTQLYFSRQAVCKQVFTRKRD